MKFKDFIVDHDDITNKNNSNLRKFVLNEDARTNFLETAQCIGIVAPSSLVKRIDDFLKTTNTTIEPSGILSDIKSVLDSSYDWNSNGKKMIKNVEPDNISSIVEICSLISGMASFMIHKGSKIISNPKFIHGRINDYYKAEKNSLGEIKGSKDNTADCIICSHSASQVIDAMNKKTPVEPDHKGGFVRMGNIKFIQVSLKKSKAGAQLGKIANFLGKNFGMTVTPSTATRELGLNEGAWDRIKGIAGSIWNKIKKAISSLMAPFKMKYFDSFSKGPSDKDVKDLAKIIGIKESLILEGSISDTTKSIVESVARDPSAIVNAINNVLRDAIRLSESGDMIYGIWDKLSPVKNITGDKTAEAFALISNYCAAKTIVNMTRDATKIGDVIRRLISEMLFGGTKLPLWKVYGNFNSSEKSYEYLGTIDTFMSEKPEINTEVFGFRVSPVKFHYNYKLLFLENVDENKKSYVELRAGTNSSSHLTFNIEGTKIHEIPLESSISGILSKKR